MLLHLGAAKDGKTPLEITREVFRHFDIPTLPEGRFLCSFSHIFAGGYSAGYYGYKWAEVLAADGYSLFEEKGIFDKATATKFRKLLQSGGTEHPMDLYVAFRGHKPQTKALIDQMGLTK
jgi:peptidyl-dipeptidase Dcp